MNYLYGNADAEKILYLLQEEEYLELNKINKRVRIKCLLRFLAKRPFHMIYRFVLSYLYDFYLKLTFMISAQIAKKFNLLSVLEQLSSSLGNFLFILVGANILIALDFGIVALQWGLIMMGLILFYSLILLPISSSKNSDINQETVVAHSIFNGLLILSNYVYSASFWYFFYW